MEPKEARLRVRPRLPRSSRGWTRTSDKTVNSRLLYQLSYAGKFPPVKVDRTTLPQRGGVSRTSRVGSAPPVRGPYRPIRMMRDAAVKRVLNTLPQKVTFSLSREL